MSAISKLDDIIFDSALRTGERPRRIDLSVGEICDLQIEILSLADVLPQYEPQFQSTPDPEVEPGWVIKYKGIPVYRRTCEGES